MHERYKYIIIKLSDAKKRLKNSSYSDHAYGEMN